MTQIRAGVATGIFLLSIPSILNRDFKTYVGLILLATVFHNSAIIALPLYFLKPEKINMRIWMSALFIFLFLFLIHYDIISILEKINIPIFTEKLNLYLEIQSWQKVKINPFNTFILIQFGITVLLSSL